MDRYDEAFVNIPKWVKAAELEYDMPIKDLIRAILDQAPYLEQTCEEVAREFGVSGTRLSQVVQAYGWRWPNVRTAAHRAARAAVRPEKRGLHCRVVTIDGHAATVQDHLDARGWPSLATVRRRLSKGMTLEEAITAPKMSIEDRTRKASAIGNARKREYARQRRSVAQESHVRV